MIKTLFLLGLLSINCVICSFSKRITGEIFNYSSKRKSRKSGLYMFKRFKKDDTAVSRLEQAIKSDDLRSFTSILKTEGCKIMEPEQSNLLNNLIESKNENFLVLLFSKACRNNFYLFQKAIDLAFVNNDKIVMKALLTGIYENFVLLSDSLVNKFVSKNDFDSISMILDIGYSLDSYKGSNEKNIAHIAAENGRLDIIKQIKSCYLFRKRDIYGQNPIFYANDVNIIKEIRRKCMLTRDQKNKENLTSWQVSLLSKDFVRLNALISLKRRIKKFKKTFINFYDIAWRSTASILRINRENILSDSYKEVKNILNKWYTPKNEFFIKYIGEIGIDSGGLKVDWVNNLFKKFFSEDVNTSVFIKIDEESGCYAPNVDYHPNMFKFAGSVVALSIGLGVPMKVKLIPAIYRLIFQEPLDFERDLLDQSPSLYLNLRKLQDPSIKLSELDLTFPNNPNKKVMKRNLTKYIEEYSLNSIYGAYKLHIEAFVEGFKSVLSDPIGHFITSDELIRILVGNSTVYNAEDFISNCTCSSSQVKMDLYEVITEFTPKQKSLLLKFVTGSETLPLEGFSGLETGGIKVCVLDELFDKLPTSSTCSNLLKLPPYFSTEELKTKLVYAIEMTETIDFEPGVEEEDEIILGFDDGNTLVPISTIVDSESEVSSHEEEKEAGSLETRRPFNGRFRRALFT